jgi:hypothetical protein
MNKHDLVLFITPIIKNFIELNDLSNTEIRIMFRIQDKRLIFVTIADEEKIKVN